MTIDEKIKDIILTMIEYNLLDKSRLCDTDYVIENVLIYLKARKFVIENFKGMF